MGFRGWLFIPLACCYQDFHQSFYFCPVSVGLHIVFHCGKHVTEGEATRNRSDIILQTPRPADDILFGGQQSPIRHRTWAPSNSPQLSVDDVCAGERWIPRVHWHLCKLWSDVLPGPLCLLLHTPHLFAYPLFPSQRLPRLLWQAIRGKSGNGKKELLSHDWKCGFIVASGPSPSHVLGYTLVK